MSNHRRAMVDADEMLHVQGPSGETVVDMRNLAALDALMAIWGFKRIGEWREAGEDDDDE